MRSLLLFIISICLFYSCSSELNQNSNEQGNFNHTVYFWLKHPESKADCKAFETSLINFINQSEYILTKHVGVPAQTNRPVIDRSYTYCLSLTFANRADQDLYQNEAVHLKFIEESSHLWEKVVVYDSENILKP